MAINATAPGPVVDAPSVALGSAPSAPTRGTTTDDGWTSSPCGDETSRSPCDGCARRPTCVQPCADLRRLLPLEHLVAFKEVGSRALMEGRLAGPSLADLDPQPTTEPVTEARREQGLLATRLVQALPAAHRHVLTAHARGDRLTAIARACGTTTHVTRLVLVQAIRYMRDELAAVDASHAVQPTVTTIREALMATTAKGPSPRLLCAAAGCNRPVGKSAPPSADLAPLCHVHRKKAAGPAGTAARTASFDGPIIPTSRERAAVDQLVARMADGSSESVAISPGMASALLERNQDNRAVSPGRVEEYAQDMLAGAWALNNQGIGIGADGRLIDGQHRLLAVMRARTTVTMLMIGGLSDAARGTIDQGRARSLGDTLRILDHEPEGHRIASCFKAWDVVLAGRPKPLSLEMVRRRLAQHEQSVRWLLSCGLRKRPYYTAAVGGALLYAHAAAPDAVENFVRRYATGADLPYGSPVLLLRDYMAARNRDAPRVVVLKVLRAVTAELRGETLERLPASDEGLEHFRKLHEARAIPLAA